MCGNNAIDEEYNVNAKEEFLDIIDNKKVKCAFVQREDWITGHPKIKKIVLKENYTESEYKKFLKKLDFEYDSGYGCQEVYGMIWMENGDWITREEYDGSEWWKYRSCPEIYEECKRKEVQK